MTNWNVVFEDHFLGETLNRDKWRTLYRWGRNNPTNQELQRFDDNAHIVANSILHLEAREETKEGYDYQSGMIATWDNFYQEYGRFEIRCKFPLGKGFWPCFWLLPQSPPEGQESVPEIDVAEFEGSSDWQMFGNFHWLDVTKQKESFTMSQANWAQSWHTYLCEWSPTVAIYYADGWEYGRHTTPMMTNGPMYLIAGLTIGGLPWPGYPDENTTFPAYFDIDYIRVYTST